MHNFKELLVWNWSISFAKRIYEISSASPSDEKFGLVSQIRRCAVSISSNIAEGAGRKTNKDFSNSLSISLGSQFEIETQLIISNEVGFVSQNDLENLLIELNEIQKMTRALIDKFS